jgi:hypothetical protein
MHFYLFKLFLVTKTGTLYIKKSWYLGSAMIRISILKIRKSIDFAIILTSSVPNPDPWDPYVFRPPGSASGSIIYLYGSGSGSLHQQAKTRRKTLISTVLWLLYGFLSLKNDVRAPPKKNKHKNFVGILKITDEKSRIRIRTEMLSVWHFDTDPENC